MSDFLAKAPAEAWLALSGVILGSLLTTLGVWLTNRSSERSTKLRLVHQEKLAHEKNRKEKLEELYVLSSHWLTNLFANSLHLSFVMKGKITYNEYMDLSIKSSTNREHDFSRLEMIVGIYGQSLKETYDDVLEARSRVNRIAADHKAAYEKGQSGERFLETFTSAQIELERCLKGSIINTMENENEKRKILIIDDDNFMLDMYSLKFKEKGFDVHTSINSKQALDKLREEFSPDVILFDIIMPDIGGLELLKTIKDENLAEGAVLIALSNQWQESEIKKAKELGADDYIVKANMVPSEVLNKVEEVMKNHNKN